MLDGPKAGANSRFVRVSPQLSDRLRRLQDASGDLESSFTLARLFIPGSTILPINQAFTMFGKISAVAFGAREQQLPAGADRLCRTRGV